MVLVAALGLAAEPADARLLATIGAEDRGPPTLQGGDYWPSCVKIHEAALFISRQTRPLCAPLTPLVSVATCTGAWRRDSTRKMRLRASRRRRARSSQLGSCPGRRHRT
eukprot:1387161-Prymnesium_polylepis.1